VSSIRVPALTVGARQDHPSHPLRGSECEVFAEINPTDVPIFREIDGIPRSKNLAVLDYIGAIGDLQCFPDVVIGY
jgi:hypothetical protein